jgi:hypothetical protein
VSSKSCKHPRQKCEVTGSPLGCLVMECEAFTEAERWCSKDLATGAEALYRRRLYRVMATGEVRGTWERVAQ